ncbi:MAG TPA: hypothetical protein VFQ65_22070, partial [Kofleriaceae bacterium]|nr:hypothetical protein [Kofleriaceae bacterium]
MMDPLGHLGARRTLASTSPKAIVWAPEPHLAAWIASELRAANVEPLRAVSFRHVETGLRTGLQPRCVLAVIDVREATDEQLGALVSARWAGYRGPIVTIGEIAPRWTALAHLTPVAIAGPLRDRVAAF